MSTHGISGAGRQLAALSLQLARHGVELRILLLVRPNVGLAGYDTFLDDLGVTYETFEDRGPIDTRLVRNIARYLNQWQPDLIETSDYKSAGIIYALRRLGRKTPWVGFFHGATDLGPRDRFYNGLHNTMLGAADRIVVMSERQCADFARHGANTSIIHNAVLPMPAIQRDEPGLARLAAFRERNADPLIGVIGRLSREKGVDIFLDAMAMVARDGIACSAAIVGDGPLQAELESQAQRLSLADKVLFLGRVESMHKIYPALDLQVIPSRSEGLPVVLLEALDADLPVVSTPVGAIPEVHAIAPDAFVMVGASDPALLADGIRTALAEPDRAQRRPARAKAVEALSLEHRTQRCMALYSSMIADTGSPS